MPPRQAILCPTGCLSTWGGVLCCEACLQRLYSEYINLYQCHLDDLERVDVFLEAFGVL